MPAFQFVETMAGSYRLLDPPSDERPMSFTVRARSPRLAEFLRRREVAIEGEVDAEDFADHRPLRGSIGLDVLGTGLLPYRFEFTANDARRYRFDGTKRVHLSRFVRSMTTLPGEILDEAGRAVARAELRFDVRGDLRRFLRSWRLT